MQPSHLKATQGFAFLFCLRAGLLERRPQDKDLGAGSFLGRCTEKRVSRQLEKISKEEREINKETPPETSVGVNFTTGGPRRGVGPHSGHVCEGSLDEISI